MSSSLKVNRLAPVLAILFFIVVPSINAQSDDVGRIQTLLESVAQNMQEGDFTALDNLYSSSRGVHIIEGAGVNHGWEDYRDNHLKPELEAFQNFEYRYFAIEPQVKGDIAYAAFRYELSADTANDHIEIEGRGTMILERMGTQWKIVHSHTSGRSKG